MSGERELDALGVTAVDQATIEARVLAQAQQAGAAPTEAPTDAADPSSLLQQLAAVRREARTVAAAVERFQQQAEEREQQAEQGDADGGGQVQEDGQAPGPPAAAPGGALQQALMQQRLAGLHAQQQQLETALQELGVVSAGAAAAGGASAEPAAAAATAGGRSRAPMRGKRQAAAPLPLTGPAAGSDKRKGKKQVQFDLAEADIFEGADAAGGAAAAAAAGGLVETERDRLIRLGILTPFDRLDGFERRIERGPRGRAGSAAGQQAQREQQGGSAAAAAAGLEGHESIRRLGEKMRAAQAARPTTMLVDASELPRPERPTRRIDEGFWRQSSSGRSALPSKKKRKRTLAPAKRHRLAPGMRHHRGGGGSGSEGEEEWSGSEGGSASAEEEEAAGSGEDLAGEFDDADAAVFEERRASYLRRQSRKAARRRRLRKAGGGGDGQQREQQAADAGGQPGELEDDVEADGLAGAAAAQPRGGGPPAGSDLRSGRERQGCSGLESDLESDLGSEEEEEEEEDVVFEGGYRLPADVWNRLFDYQRTAVKWMWELHTQRAGGIIGDEMGLGKTIQVIAFLAGLHHSGLFRPSLIVCPATVLRQWLRELRAWWPLFRVALLHDSARSGSGAGTRPSRSCLIQEIARSDCGILLTTYETMRLQRGELVGVDWGYVVLDEGHKIRNPDAEVTLAAKQMQTVHRIVMSGSPIQNRLAELWSLFDFVFPGKLGTLPVFTAQFALPIQIGGYANANPLQVSTAYKCAVILRDLIAPYLLRRRKVDVRAQLPQKTEQVLFCTLTGEQRTLYKGYLSSKELQEIFAGSRTALAGIDILRKICNHPDLLERAKWEAAEDYGNPERSGKMQVLAKVLRHWREQGHKALVFTQTQQMLDIVEKHAQAQGYTYHRMDGSTSVATRARLIDDFNNNPEVFCFLLTTRVGGLGVNLTGANRVLLYDPDWNPSTDVQARERAWRIGQTREVVIYRLITSGTIEEKVYHRQVYKHFLTDKVLRDPRQRRFFKAKDLTDLFTLGDEYADGTETASLFATLGTDVLPDEEQPEAEAAEGEGEERHASDQDDYSSGPEPSPQQAQQRQRRPSSRSSSRSRRSGSAERGGSADLPAGAGVRSEAVAQEEEGADAASGSGKGDAKILRELFEGSDVRGAIDHTKVEGANDPQRRAAEQEAARIAKRAAEALRQSRLACQQAPVNQPTWTGRSGGAGLPGGGSGQPRFGRAANPRLGPAAQAEQAAAAAVAAGGGGGGSGTTARRFGSGATGARPPLAGAGAGAANGVAPRSSEIIARLRERQAAVASAAAAAAAADPAVEQAQLLAAQIASFLEARGGAAASDELVQHFQATVGAAQLPVFRGVLKQVAALQRQPGGGKQWVLRHEYAGGGQGGQR